MLAFEQEVIHEDEVKLSELNHSFHKAIAAASDSAFIQKAYEDLLVESLRLARQCFGNGEDRKSTRQEHLTRIVADHKEIYTAIERRDSEAADRIASHHSQLFRERLSRQILGASTEISAIPMTD